MASDNEVVVIVEKQTCGRGKQHTHTKRTKSNGPSMDALEARMTGLEDTLSGIQATLSDVIDHLDGLEIDYGGITQATEATLREFQKGKALTIPTECIPKPYKMLSAVRLKETSISPASSQDVPTEGVRRRKERAIHGKRPKAMGEGTWDVGSP
ncbi:hypothetical protein Ddye_020945 [Dipteronia dyeriana]|uniref:Uncharacterized protein n=1 Tax=Dipteronia dyeriana TaxID=168575 RepID=A0AAD9WXI5_9ROSI|nr:hypothetical protein Ddye_020945 [Dipteronia dyeriana]